MYVCLNNTTEAKTINSEIVVQLHDHRQKCEVK